MAGGGAEADQEAGVGSGCRSAELFVIVQAGFPGRQSFVSLLSKYPPAIRHQAGAPRFAGARGSSWVHSFDQHGEAVLTTDLKYLAFTAILTATLWIPYVACQVMTNGFLRPENYVDPTARPVPLWGKRADRTYLNAVEVFAPFAALVVIAHVAGKANAMTAFWAMSFFWLRVVHAVVYWTAVSYIRTVVFTLGFVCVAGLFWEVIK
jgi:uncharacterized MAPEG superfamily protein